MRTIGVRSYQKRQLRVLDWLTACGAFSRLFRSCELPVLEPALSTESCRLAHRSSIARLVGALVAQPRYALADDSSHDV